MWRLAFALVYPCCHSVSLLSFCTPLYPILYPCCHSRALCIPYCIPVVILDLSVSHTVSLLSFERMWDTCQAGRSELQCRQMDKKVYKPNTGMYVASPHSSHPFARRKIASSCGVLRAKSVGLKRQYILKLSSPSISCHDLLKWAHPENRWKHNSQTHINNY